MRVRSGFVSAASVVVSVATFVVAPARAAERVLCTDDLAPNQSAGFQAGFVAGEEAAVRLTAPAGALLTRINLAYGGGDQPGEAFNETFRIYAADGTGELGSIDDGFPGTTLREQEAPLVDSTSDASEVVLDEPVPVSGAFWVSIVAGHDGAPFVARDTGGYDNVSAIRGDIGLGTVDWWDNETAAVPGDWVIRAVVETDVPLDDSACRFAAGEGEGDVEGEGEGDVEGEGEGEGDVGGEGEGDVISEGEGDVEGDDLFVSSITPSTAAVGAAIDVVVLGGGFVDGATVRIGAEALDAVVVDSAGALRGRTVGTLPAGTYDVVVQQGAAVFTFPSGFLVTPLELDDGGDSAGDAPDGGCAAGPSGALSGCALVLLALRRRRRA